MDNARAQQIGAVYIPPAIMCQEKLTLTQKVIWGRIQGLSTKEGYCYASNAWIGKQIGINKNTVSNNISTLVQLGYIERKIIRNTNDKSVVERRLIPIQIPF